MVKCECLCVCHRMWFDANWWYIYWLCHVTTLCEPPLNVHIIESNVSFSLLRNAFSQYVCQAPKRNRSNWNPHKVKEIKQKTLPWIMDECILHMHWWFDAVRHIAWFSCSIKPFRCNDNNHCNSAADDKNKEPNNHWATNGKKNTLRIPFGMLKSSPNCQTGSYCSVGFSIIYLFIIDSSLCRLEWREKKQ